MASLYRAATPKKNYQNGAKNMISHGDQNLVAPAEQHDNAAAQNVEPSSLLLESSVEPPHLSAMSSKLHGLTKMKLSVAVRQARGGRKELDNLWYECGGR
jgi:hypothetical protein